jgi:hypothetical protein
MLRQIIERNTFPKLIVGTVTSHSSRKTFIEVSPEKLDLAKHSRRWSLRVPYQEAIAGQVYRTSFIRDNWPSSPKYGNTWPHIELAMDLSRSDDSRIYRANLPIASMHEAESGWYNQPGQGLLNIKKQLAILWANLIHGGLGHVVKILELVLIGIPRTILQDKQSFKWRQTESS